MAKATRGAVNLAQFSKHPLTHTQTRIHGHAWQARFHIYFASCSAANCICWASSGRGRLRECARVLVVVGVRVCVARDFCAVACSARNKACLHCRCCCCCCESLAKKSLATKTNRTHVSWPAQVESKAVEKTFQFECGEGV